MTIYVGSGSGGRGLLNAQTVSGVDPTGAISSTAGLLNAIAASLPNQGLYVPAGTYLFSTTLDTSALSVSQNIRNWSLICDPGAVFQASSSLGANPLLKLVPPSTYVFTECAIQLGALRGYNCPAQSPIQGNGTRPTFTPTTGQHGAIMNNFYGCNVVVMSAMGCDDGVLIDEQNFNLAQAAFGDNDLRLGVLAYNNNGFVTDSPGGANSGFSFQGNRVQIGDAVYNYANGIVNDVSGIARGSQFNYFEVGAAEFNASTGIKEFAQHNRWWVNNTNSNGATGFYLVGSAGNKSVIEGFFVDGFNLNGNTPTFSNYN